MKTTHPTRRQEKLPKARVMRMHPWSLSPSTKTPPRIFHQKVIASGLRHSMPVAVTPCRTLGEAREMVKVGRFFALGEEERERVLAQLFSHAAYSPSRLTREPVSLARAVLRAITQPALSLNPKEKGR